MTPRALPRHRSRRRVPFGGALAALTLVLVFCAPLAAQPEAAPDVEVDAPPANEGPADESPPDESPPDESPPDESPPDESPPDESPAETEGPPDQSTADTATPESATSSDDDYGVHDDGEDSYAEEEEASDGYRLERVEVVGNERTRGRVIRSYVPVERGEVFDPRAPEIERLEWHLLGTGWFHDVHLSLRRGTRRGWVVLVVEVEERNTVVVDSITFGISEGVNGSRDRSADLVPYVGFSLGETNLFGLGMRLRLAALLSRPQQGFELSFVDPRFLGSTFSLRLGGFFNNAHEFFGRNPLVVLRGEPAEGRNAVVLYHRGGFQLGTGRDLGRSTHYSLDYRLETVNVTAMPDAASTRYGSEIRPIDFAIENGRSYVSLLRFGLSYDRRDDPGLPQRGSLVRLQVDAASRILGSDYDFLRGQASVQGWVRLPWGHVLRLGLYGGVVFGEAPFFYLFHASDLTDLIPSRVLEMELDRRVAPNVLGTAVVEMRAEELAARADIEYNLRLYRGSGGLRALDAYFGAGLYFLADPEALRVGVPGYEGASRVPFDLTFDVGLRFDTDVGVFQFGFSNILGFIEL